LDFPGFEKGKLAFQFEDLLAIRPIQEILKLAAHGEGMLFQATITFAHRLGSFKILGDKTRGWIWLKP